MIKKNKIIRLLSTSLFATAIISVTQSAQAACDYNNDTTIVGGLIVCDNVKIYGNSTTEFTGGVKNSLQNLFDIYNTAKPTFAAGVVLDNATNPMKIYGQSEPVFKGTVLSGSITISDSAKPNFSGKIEVSGDLQIHNTSSPVFSNEIIVGGKLRMTSTLPSAFSGPVTAQIISILSPNVSFTNTVHATQEMLMDSGTLPIFTKNVSVDGNLILNNDTQPTFSGTVTATEMQFIDISTATATFTASSVLDAPVTTDDTNTGSLIFKSGATVNKLIGEEIRPLDT
jgi:hypothetical protein